MDEIRLGMPEPPLESLPEDADGAGCDVERAVDGDNERLRRAIEGGNRLSDE